MTPVRGDAQALPWLDALQDPATYPHAVRDVLVLHTHLSVVALTGDYAYKVKKPVDYGFADFSTLELRRRACEAELRLNRRTAPDLYLEIVSLSRTVGGWRIVAGGPPEEFAVRMRQFRVEDRLDRVAERGELTPAIVEAIALRVADLHTRAGAAEASFAASYPQRLARAIADNFKLIPENEASRALRSAFDARLTACSSLLERRARDGRVRDCHGDLHLANICLWKSEPLIFDCIEFNDDLRVIDVLSDAAFLWMDLVRCALRSEAQLFLNRYLEVTGDYSGLPAWPLFVAYRAHVRAKVAHLTASSTGVGAEEQGKQEALRERYLGFAAQSLAQQPGGLVMLCGLPASGKSSEALRIACAENGVRVRSDVERKRLHREDPSKDLYGEELGRATYAKLLAHARAITQGGLTAVLDATYLRRDERREVLRLAGELRVPMRIVHCEATPSVLAERARLRRAAGNDASDADEAVVLAKAAEWEPFTEEEKALVTRRS